jgi:hypothetical protein
MQTIKKKETANYSAIQPTDWSHIYYLRIKSRIENEVPTLALPAHGLVVGDAIPSGVRNCRREMASPLDFHLRRNGDLNCLAVPAWAAPSLAPWWPWSYLGSHHPPHFLLFYPFLYTMQTFPITSLHRFFLGRVRKTGTFAGELNPRNCLQYT